MSLKELQKLEDKLRATSGWGLHASSIALMAGWDEPYSRVALSRACKAGTLQRLSRGFYRFTRLRLPVFHLEQLACWLRPNDFFYLSLESVLSDEGRISQIPNRLTFMTTGRSYTYNIPGVGCIEFVHTSTDPETWGDAVVFNSARKIRIATAARAESDLRRVGRNLDLLREDDDEDDYDLS